MITCCNGCTRRFIGCHAVCGEYAAQKTEHDKMVDKRRKQAMTSAGLYEQRSQAVRKVTKRKLGGG